MSTHRLATLARQARLLLEAGFLAPDSYQHVLDTSGASDQTWGQFLSQDVGAAARRLTSRMKHGGVEDEDITTLSPSITVHLPELIYITDAFEPNVDDLLDLLVESGALSGQRADTITQTAKDDAAILKALFDERALSPRTINNILKLPEPILPAVSNRVEASIDLLDYNGILPAEETEHLVEKANALRVPVYELLEEALDEEGLEKYLLAGLEPPALAPKLEDVPEDWEEVFPAEFMARARFIPLDWDEEFVTIAVDNPYNYSVADLTSILSGRTVLQAFIPPATMDDLLKELMPQGISITDSVSPVSEGGEFSEREFSKELLAFEEMQADSASTVDIVHRILESAVNAGATDIHFERLEHFMRIRFRIDGALRAILEVPQQQSDAVVSRLKVLCGLDITERRRPQDGNFHLQAGEQRFDFRVATLPTPLGEKVVLRVLDAVSIVRPLDELGLSAEQEEDFRSAIKRPYGLILVTGPTGSGKTTTLYAGLSLLNTPNRNLLTIEDPVEYRLDGVSQVQIDGNIDLTFASGLRAALRQDPDVIMVGEIRDPETAGIAMRASLTGHLVFSTLHSNTAVGAISSLRFLGAKSYLIASSLLMVVAQRLLRRICQNCKTEAEITNSIIADLGLDQDFNETIYTGTGCDRCTNSGYKGRLGIYEVLPVRERLRLGISDEYNEKQLREIGLMEGVKTLHKHALEKVLAGATSAEEAIQQTIQMDG